MEFGIQNFESKLLHLWATVFLTLYLMTSSARTELAHNKFYKTVYTALLFSATCSACISLSPIYVHINLCFIRISGHLSLD